MAFFNLKKITSGPSYICNNISKPDSNYSPPTLCYTHSKISTKECRILSRHFLGINKYRSLLTFNLVIIYTWRLEYKFNKWKYLFHAEALITKYLMNDVTANKQRPNFMYFTHFHKGMNKTTKIIEFYI